MAQALAEAGIKKAFGLPGGEVLVLIDELRKAGVDFVLMRHEANAGIAAAVYGKLNRQPGVVIATLGPGAANLLLPIASAYLDQEPLLAITAQIPDEFPASHTHQLLPLHDTFRPMCRVVEKVTQSNVERRRRPGAGRVHGSAVRRVVPDAVGARSDQAAADDRPQVSRGAADAADGQSRRRGRPICARGARWPSARWCSSALASSPSARRRLRRWLDEWQLPFAVTPKVKGIVDETSPNFVGVISGMAADGLMVDALNAADLLIGFGLDPVEIDKTWHAELDDPVGARSAQRHRRDAERHAARQSRAAARRAAGRAAAAHVGSSVRGVPEEAQRPAERQRRRAGHDVAGRHHSRARRCGAGETIVTTDVGSHKYLFGQFWPSRHPETFWMSNGLSGMAYGLSAAIGAKLARPDVPVLAAVGDGGFSMNAQELETAERVGAPFVTVVLEDGSYSLIKLAQENRKLEPYRMDFSPIDNVKMAEACGVQGAAHVESRRDGVGGQARGRREEEPGRRRSRALRRLSKVILGERCRTSSIR